MKMMKSKTKLWALSAGLLGCLCFGGGDWLMNHTEIPLANLIGYGDVTTRSLDEVGAFCDAVVYWSGTGNTAAMASAVEAGARDRGAEVSVFGPDEFTPDKVSDFDAIAFGCPAMGAEVLEESSYDPMFTAVEGSLSGKKIALFGSYGWGDGQWMRDWEDRCNAAGAQLACDSVMANNAPGEDALEECRNLGAALA